RNKNSLKHNLLGVTHNRYLTRDLRRTREDPPIGVRVLLELLQYNNRQCRI
ncbi:hypothetical protein J6590_036756, partial [Homalodisca vitripennis]